MRTLHRWQLLLGLVLTGVTGAVQSAAALSPNVQASFTVEVRNYAEVDSKELAEAERMTAAIFRRAGVAASWVEAGDVSENQDSNLRDQSLAGHSHIRVHILTQLMADRFPLPNDVMGLAPGSGPDRKVVCIFYDRVKELAHRQATAQLKGTMRERAGVSQILGAMIAHEIGHVLLNLPSHSETGIMRGDWDLKVLQDVAYGDLFFTQPQAEVIRAEVIRRAT